jgi:hypothetical protein
MPPIAKKSHPLRPESAYHEFGGARKPACIVVDDTSEATLQMEEDMPIDYNSTKLHDEYPQVVQP